jgi:2-polyprenyl-3-methyl-5-hydroxy-6-metoxy-1,4-benzoquinol methylase
VKDRPRAKQKVSTTDQLPSINNQRQFWNEHWQQWQERKVLNEWTERRATEILQLIRGLPVERPRMLDFGCGIGWFTERLSDLGEAHGIDLSPEGIATARARRPDIPYLAGSVYDAPLPTNYFDVVVSQEVIAHVENQRKYVDRAADVLRAGGYFIVTTGNKFVMDRLGNVGWFDYPPDHIEQELSRTQLKKLLSPRFRVLRASTILPIGTLGILRWVNSVKLNSWAQKIISEQTLTALKERAGFGWQTIALAQKKS